MIPANSAKIATKPAPHLTVEKFTGEQPEAFLKVVSDQECIEQLRKTCKITATNSGINDIQRAYLAYKIDLDEELAPPPVAMYIKDEDGKPITLFSKGNFSIGTGAAKAKKTFLGSMLMAAAVDGSYDVFQCPNKGMNVWFCTEQARYKVQQIGKRIATLAGTKDNLQIYSLRTLDPLERRQIIKEVLQDTPNLNFVVIDGIIDLDIDPIMQADQAQGIIQDLMFWSEIYNIHIFCVIHFNKTVDTLLGHLGSFAHRKADAIISVTKDKNNSNISIVQAVDTREKPFSPFSFTVDEHGLPQILGNVEAKQSESKRALLAKDVPEQTHRLYLGEIYSVKPDGFTYAELIDKIKLKYQEYGIEFGLSKAREFLSHCENLGVIKHNEKKGRAAKYIFLPV